MRAIFFALQRSPCPVSVSGRAGPGFEHQEAYCAAVVRRVPPLREGSICGPSFRLLTALEVEEPHPPAGIAYLPTCAE